MKKLIVLDAGHGGSDPGASGNGLIEKIITLLLVNKIAARLAKYEVDIYFTRDSDKYVSLSGRAKFANDLKADFFLSIHTDAFGNSAANGASIYRHTNAGQATQATQELLHIEYAKVLRKYDVLDRGCKYANFAVLRETNMPALLIENGFITNPKDASLLKNNQFLDDLADGIVAGIDRALSLVEKEDNNEVVSGAVEVMQKAGITLSDPGFWIANARVGKQVPGEYVAALFEKVAAKLRG